MELRERRLAQILRDFMEAYVVSAEVGAHLRATDLDFARVQRLVGEYEEAALYRLKEECHALFRFDQESSKTELQAEELFDLAVGALFHEAMKFREGYYVTTSYGPRLERMMSEGSAAGPLAESFRNVIEAGRQRMLESEVEMAELFDETRDQLLILLRQLRDSGAIARSLVEDPDMTEQVFGTPVPGLLETLFGSAQRGYQLALENLIANGHYAEALELMERPHAVEPELVAKVKTFVAGMEHFIEGETPPALEHLGQWIRDGAQGREPCRQAARKVLDMIAETNASSDLSEQARVLLQEL
jgi:hypothetical protein